MPITAIFLDFYGTIVHEDEQVIALICHEIKKSTETNASPAQIGTYWWHKFSELINQSFGDNFKTQREIETLSLKSTLDHLGSTLYETELSELMFQHWRTSPLFDDAKIFFDHIDLPVYVLSNIDTSDLQTIINRHRLKIDGFITSEDVRSYKPRPELFDQALKRYQLAADEVLHVGDSLSSDVIGAKKAGIRCVWINRNHKSLPDSTCSPDFTISELDELLKIVYKQGHPHP
jgi:2-haloacid dehalogenase/putative hydrolase of the HAD superfamily